MGTLTNQDAGRVTFEDLTRLIEHDYQVTGRRSPGAPRAAGRSG